MALEVQGNRLKELRYMIDDFKERVQDAEDDVFGEWFMAVDHVKMLRNLLDDCLSFCKDLNRFLGEENEGTGK